MLSERILSSLSLFFEKNNMRELSQAEGGKNHDSTWLTSKKKNSGFNRLERKNFLECPSLKCKIFGKCIEWCNNHFYCIFVACTDTKSWLPWWEVSEIPRFFPDFFLKKCKISLTNWINSLSISPDNGLNPFLTAIPSTHLFMLSASYLQCIWIECVFNMTCCSISWTIN